MFWSRPITKTAITFGVFDCLNIGHTRLFHRIREHCGEPCRLAVIIHTSEYVEATKPEAQMLYSTEERVEMLYALRLVDDVIVHPDQLEYVAGIEFDVFARGADQNSPRILAFDQWCRAKGKEVIIMPRTEGISSSGIKSGIIMAERLSSAILNR